MASQGGYIEVRRHAERQDRSDNLSHLSRAGVRMARAVGEQSGPFSLVISSPLPRATETAIAMGFAVDEVDEAFQDMNEAVHAEVDWDAGFAAWGAAYARGGAVAKYADGLVELLDSIKTRLPDEDAALVTTHGGIVEACAIGAAPEADHRSFGAPIGYCEGVRIFDAVGGKRIELLRVPQTS